MSNPHDPRDEAERARAALKANAELGLAMPESPAEAMPSVTPATFGESTGFKDAPPASAEAPDAPSPEGHGTIGNDQH